MRKGLMKKYVLAVAIGSSAFISLPTLAAAVSFGTGFKAQVHSVAVRIFHCRNWSGILPHGVV